MSVCRRHRTVRDSKTHIVEILQSHVRSVGVIVPYFKVVLGQT